MDFVSVASCKPRSISALVWGEIPAHFCRDSLGGLLLSSFPTFGVNSERGEIGREGGWVRAANAQSKAKRMLLARQKLK